MCIIMYVYMCMNDILFDVFIFRLKTNRQRWRIFLICCLNEGMCMHVCVYMYGQYTIELWLFKYWAMCSLALRCTERLFRQSCGYFLYLYDQGAFYLFLSSRFIIKELSAVCKQQVADRRSLSSHTYRMYVDVCLHLGQCSKSQLTRMKQNAFTRLTSSNSNGSVFSWWLFLEL